jgi:hypothetical protein
MTNTRTLSLLATAALAAASLHCASAPARQVGVTRNQELVSGCQSLGEVEVGARVASDEINSALAQAGERKGADYVVVASDGARTGTAYRCASPSMTSPS